MITSDPLCSLKRIVTDDGRHRDLDPLLRRSKLESRTLATGGRWQGLVSVVQRASFIRRILQHLAEAGDGPHRFTGRAGNTILIEAAADAPHRVAAGHEIIEDAAHHHGFWFIDRQVAGTGRTSWDPSVAIGNQTEDDLPSPSTEEASASVAFGDLGAFVMPSAGLCRSSLVQRVLLTCSVALGSALESA